MTIIQNITNSLSSSKKILYPMSITNSLLKFEFVHWRASYQIKLLLYFFQSLGKILSKELDMMQITGFLYGKDQIILGHYIYQSNIKPSKLKVDGVVSGSVSTVQRISSSQNASIYPMDPIKKHKYIDDSCVKLEEHN